MSFWSAATRLGEAQILLPVALLTALSFVRRPDGRQPALRWLVLIGAATLLTTASKVAFMGWGVGIAALDFTGISGHTMFATAIYPMLAASLVAGHPRALRAAALAVGAAVALLVGVSRLAVHAHTPSEVLAGWAAGAVALAAMPTLWRRPDLSAPRWLPAVVAAWLVLMPAHAPASTTHGMVTRLSLVLSGRSTPYTREEMRREHQRRLAEAQAR